MDSKKTGILAILGASIMWASEPVFAKLAYRNSDFIHTSAVRALVVAVVAFLYVLVTNKRNLRVTKKQVSSFVYLALAGTVFADLIYFYALTKIPVVNAVIIGHMQPIFIVFLGYFVLREDKLTRHDYLGIILMILAGILVTTKHVANLTQLKLGTMGDVYVLGATIGWSTTAIVMRKYLKDVHAGVVTFYRFFFASIVFGVYLSCTSSVEVANPYQVFVGIVAGIGTILYYESLKRIKAAQVSALELSTPFFAAILGFYVLRESITWIQIGGILLLVVGVYLLSRKEEVYF